MYKKGITFSKDIKDTTEILLNCFNVKGKDIATLSTQGEIIKLLECYKDMELIRLKQIYKNMLNKVFTANVDSLLNNINSDRNAWDEFCTDCMEATLMNCVLSNKPIPGCPVDAINGDVSGHTMIFDIKETENTKVY